MPLRRTTDEQLEQAQERLAQLFGGPQGSPVEQARAPTNGGAPDLKNVEAVRKILAVSTFQFEGRLYTVKKMPFETGLALLEQDMLVKRIAAMVASGTLLEEYRKAAQRIAEMIWQVAEPVDRWQRWSKRLGFAKNPFLGASDIELGGLKDFCLTRRMASTVHLVGLDDELQ